MPLRSKNSLYEKVRGDEDPLDDFFQEHMGLQSLFSKIALLSFFAFIISFASVELHNFTFVTFAGFLLFSTFYLFVRIKK